MNPRASRSKKPEIRFVLKGAVDEDIRQRIEAKGLLLHFLKAAFSISTLRFAGTAASFLYSAILAAYFGLGAELDAYYMAMAVPMFMATIIQPVVQVVFVPVLSRVLVAQSRTDYWKAVNNYLNLTWFVLSVASICTGVAYPRLLAVLVPGFTDERLELTLRLGLILLSAIPLSGMLEVMRATLLSLERFTLQASDSLIQSLTGMIVVLLLASRVGVQSVAFGFLLGMALQVMFFGGALSQEGFRYKLSFNHSDIGMNEIRRRVMWPCLGVFVSQGVVLAERSITSLMPVGSVAALAMARRILITLSAVIVSPVSLSVFPRISKLLAEKDFQSAQRNLEVSIKLFGFLSMLISVMIFALRVPLVALLFQRGAFDETATIMLSHLLGGYVLALPFWGISSILQKVFYGNGEVKTPTLQLILVAVVNVTLDFVLIPIFGTPGIPIAFTLSSVISLAMSIWLLRKIMHLKLSREIEMFMAKVLASAILTYAFLQLITGKLMALQVRNDTWFVQTANLVLLWVLGTGVFVGLLLLAFGGKIQHFIKAFFPSSQNARF